MLRFSRPRVDVTVGHAHGIWLEHREMPVNIDDFRKAARKRLPRALFDYIDGGSDDERTLRANQADFARYTFRPRALVDVETRDQTTTVLGQAISSPLILAPTGFTGVFWPNAEVCAARA